MYPGTTPQQIPIFRFDPLVRAAAKSGFDKPWLTANVPAAKSAIDKPAMEGIYTGQKAFEHWASCFEKIRKSSETADSDTLLSSLHAAVYLANTRTLAWLSIANGKAGLPAEDNAKVLDLLQTEVNTANELIGRVIRLFAASAEQPCDECQGMLDGIIESISTITSIEERIVEYEARR